MHTSSTSTSPIKDINFTFKTIYLGNEIVLNIISNEDRYSVLQNDKTIGHIKLGDVRHTWFVVDSKYVAPYLVNEIGDKIVSLTN
jgi:hypothetical protein